MIGINKFKLNLRKLDVLWHSMASIDDCSLMLLVVQDRVVYEARDCWRLFVDVEKPEVNSSDDDTEGDE